jgi:hypothetical protein
MRILLLAFFCLLTAGLSADELSVRLRLLIPGDDPATVNERQFLYQRIDGMLRCLKEEDKITRKTINKQVARIKDRLEKSYLKTYRAEADLAAAFRKGHYNDATAAVLTALTFEHFGIDYDGYVDHWESYLIADPDGAAVAVRHPATTKRNEKAERIFRREYLSIIRSTLEEDIPPMSTDEADAFFFKYHYSPTRRLSFGQLSAYLLFRNAQAAYGKSDYAQCLALVDEGMRREERLAFLVLRRAAELQIAALNRPEMEGEVDEFFQQWKENPDNRYLPAALLQHFDREQQVLLAREEEHEAQVLLTTYLEKAPEHQEEWSENLRQLQDLRFLTHYHKRGRLDLAKRMAEHLYRQHPDNETVRFILGELIIDGLRNTSAKGAEFQRQVEGAAAKYPFIQRQDRFADLLLREKAWKVRDLYATDQFAEAKRALVQFRETLINIPIGRERSLWTLTVFAAAADYHFRMGEYDLAREFIEEGLEYGPDDQFLLHRKEVLANY